MTTRFKTDNTDGYSQGDLDVLNAAFDAIMVDNASAWCMADGSRDDYKSWQDHVAETLLSRYDAGERGESLER